MTFNNNKKKRFIVVGYFQTRAVERFSLSNGRFIKPVFIFVDTLLPEILYI